MRPLPAGRSLLLTAALAVGLVAAGAVAARAAIRLAALPWLGGGPGEWIVYPSVPTTSVRIGAELYTAFRRELDLAAPPASAAVDVRCFRRCQVAINGRPGLEVGGPGDPSPWLVTRTAEVAPLLRAGRNEIVAVVANDSGPPALSLALTGFPGADALATDTSWQASLAGASWRPARRAAEPLAVDVGLPDPAVASLAGALAAHRGSFLAVVLVSAAVTAGGFLLVRRVPHPRRHQLLPGLVALVATLWLALYLHNAGRLPLGLGFDAKAHLAYVDFVQHHHALPRPDQLWEGYQPPLYYLLAAGLLGACGLTVADPGAAWVLRGLSFAGGIAQVLLVFAVVRLLVPRRPFAQAMALVFAGFLPVHLYLFQFASNEALVAPLATASLLLALRLARHRRRAGWGAYAGVGACFGAALLTKVSALLLAPAVGVALLAPRRGRGGGLRARLAGAAVAVAACLAVAGWHFGRVWAEYGNPLVGNWDPALGFAWWQDPGYRTLGDYLRFGRALVAPWFAGFAGVWDGLWSTLWGDGLASGRIQLRFSQPWNLRLMTIGFVLATVPAAAVTGGAATALHRLVPRWRGRARTGWWVAVLAAAFALAGWLAMTLRIASYAQAKAFYVLVAAAPVAAFVALAAAALGRRRWLRVAFAALMTIWAVNAYASVWLVRNVHSAEPGGVETLLAEVARRDRAGDAAGAEAAARAALDQARTRAPGEGRAHTALADLLDRAGRYEEEVAVLRDLLAIRPDDARTHRELARLYGLLGDPRAAAAHRRYAERIEARLMRIGSRG